MPERVITKPPTAELRPGQKDEDSLPPYSVLDRILEGLVDKEMSVKEVANATGEDVALVADIETQAAQGRIQAPPGAAGREDRQPQLRPRPPLSDQQLLPHRPAGEAPMTSSPASRRRRPGRLHVGNIRTALHNFLFARKNGGKFILRIDDTDRERSTAEFDQAIRDDLDWLGLDARPDRPPVGAVRPLRARVRAAEGGRAGSMPATKRPRSSIFAARCCSGAACRRSTSASPTDAPVPEGRAPHWRFRLDHDAPIVWNDLIRGEQRFDPKLLSDPVVRREDGSWLYLLPSVIDDVDLGITHVVRGEDHVSNSAAQIQMFEALGATPPQFAHEALLVAAEGKLSKRLGSYGAEHLRAEGVEPMALLSVLARIGTSQPVEPVASLDELAAGFDFATFGRAPAHFDPHEVELVNARLLHKLDFAAVADRLPAGATEEDWLLLRPNLERLADFAGWFAVLHGEIEPPELSHDERLLVKEAAAIAGELDWSAEPWRALTDAAEGSRRGKKGRELFHPLRLALTGRESGPEMAGLSRAWARSAPSAASKPRPSANRRIAQRKIPACGTNVMM